MSKSVPPLPPGGPIQGSDLEVLNPVLARLSREQLQYLNGFLASALSGSMNGTAPSGAGAAAKVPLAVLFATESGNAEGLAAEAVREASARGFAAKAIDLGEVEPSDLVGHENLLLIASTWGEGDPPERAMSFYEKLTAEDAPRFEKSRFSVFALGDSSYEHFCQFGKDLDFRFEQLGASRFHPRGDTDVDFEEPFKEWFGGAIEILVRETGAGQAATSAEGAAVLPAEPAAVFDKKNPFPSRLLERINLNGTGSAKETWHLEFSLEGSGMSYEPGDAVGVFPSNCPQYVQDLLKVSHLDGDELVRVDEEKVPLRVALLKNLDVTNLSRPILDKYQERAGNADLAKLLEDKEKVASYLWGRQIIDLLEDFPIRGIRGQDLVELLRKLPARLYSIASSPRAHQGEVHLTVGAVRYTTNGRARKGVCSTYFADLIEKEDTVPLYIHHNKNFRLPENGDTPIIMVGPGTGIAPFRAFVEDRAETGATGESWLFFGDQHFQTDFLYQLEWQDYLKRGKLSRMDVAFSRDTPEKVYVQHRMLARGREIYEWLDRGAIFYVCGDATRMAKDVAVALETIIREHGGKSEDEAREFVKQLKKERRYQQDVY